MDAGWPALGDNRTFPDAPVVLRSANPTLGKPRPYIRLRSELERTEVEVRRFAEAVDKVIAIHRDSWRPGSKSEAQ